MTPKTATKKTKAVTKKVEYVPKAIPTTIRATSRVSIKVKETFYTLEYTEERMIPDIDDVNLTAEKKALWDAVNNEVDKQVQDVYDAN